MVAGALWQWGGEGEADGAVVGEALGVERLALGVGDFGELEAVVQLEGGGGEVLERGEGDVGGGGEAIDGGVEVGADDVVGDLELRLCRGGPCRSCEEAEQEQLSGP